MNTGTRIALRCAVSLGVVIPVPGFVVRAFDPPACERCAGHRGVTIAAQPGHTVVAVAGGMVEFVGPVAGRIYVVQRVAPAVRITYAGFDPVGEGVVEGVRLGAGEPIGRSTGEAYLSVRHHDRHVEPLRALGIGRARLVGAGAVHPRSVGPRGVSR